MGLSEFLQDLTTASLSLVSKENLVLCLACNDSFQLCMVEIAQVNCMQYVIVLYSTILY